jgi:hypothetical protein
MSKAALLGLIFEQSATSPHQPPSGTPFNAYKLSGKPLSTLACQSAVWWFPSSGVPKLGTFAGYVVADPKASTPDSDRSNNAGRFSYSVTRDVSSPHR